MLHDRSRATLGFTLLVAGSTLACEAMLGAPDYHVVSSDTETLVALYAAEAPKLDACKRCLAGGDCGRAFRTCATQPECRAFSACTLVQPSPASQSKCVVELEPPATARATTEELARCYAACVNECDAGNDFGCANAYSYPATPPRSTIRLSQTLSFLLAPNESAAGLDVSICPPTMDCNEPLAVAVTDETGTYSADVPIETTPISQAGFRGYRLVHGEAGRLYTHRLYQSHPAMIDQYDRTGIAGEALAEEVLRLLGVGDELNLILLQILDCRIVGARGIYFEVDGGKARVEYLQGLGLWGEGPTLASQEGSAVALGVETGAHHEIRALTEDGELIAVDTVYVAGDELVFSLLVPKEAE